MAETYRGLPSALLPAGTCSSGASVPSGACVTKKPAPSTFVCEDSFVLALINGVSQERHCRDGIVSRDAEQGLLKSP